MDKKILIWITVLILLSNIVLAEEILIDNTGYDSEAQDDAWNYGSDGNGANRLEQAQSFEYGYDANITKIQLRYGTKSNNPSGNWNISIQTDNAGEPSGNMVNNGAYVIIDPTAIAGNTFVNHTFINGASISRNTVYWIVLRNDQVLGVPSKQFIMGHTMSNNYTDGNASYETSAGGGWQSHNVNRDLSFGLYGTFEKNLNLSDSYPATNTQFATTPVSLNVSVDAKYDFNCSYYINGSLNSSKGYSAGQNVFVELNYTNIDGSYTYLISCYNATGFGDDNSNTSENLFYIDTAIPTITANFINDTIYYKTLTAKINFSDNFMLHSYNISIDGADVNNSNLNTTTYQLSLSQDISTLSAGHHELSIRVADGHTAKELLGDYEVNNGLFNDYIQYRFKHPYKEGNVMIYQKESSIFDSWKSKRQKDRYTFSFEPHKKQQYYNLIVESDKKIEIINAPDTIYKKWLIVNEHWIDFYPYDVEFNRINDKQIEVIINTDQDILEFNSIGDLNIVTQNYTFFSVNVTESYQAVVPNGLPTTLYLNITGSQPTNVFVPKLQWNYTNYTATYIGLDGDTHRYSYAITPSITNSPQIVNHSWYINLSGSYESTDVQNQIVIDLQFTNCSVGEKILNLTLVSENNLSSLNGTIEVELEILLPNNMGTLTTLFNSTNSDNLLVCVNNISIFNSQLTADITASYIADDHVHEFWYLDNGVLNESCQFNNHTSCDVTLYDLPLDDSTTFLFQFFDEYGLSVDDAIIHTYRKYIGRGVFYEVERSKQDDNGETHVHLIEEDAIYYFMVTQYGETIYVSDTYNAKCLSTPCLIELDVSDEFTPFSTDWEADDGVYYSITSNKTTRIVTLTFTSNVSNTINFSLYSYNNNEPTLINSSVLTAISGNIELTVPLVYGNTTFFTAIYNNGNFVKSQWVDFTYDAQDYFGTTGAILSAFLIMGLGLMAISEGITLIIVISGALFLMGILMLIDLTWISIISIICAGGIIIYKVIKKKND